MDETVFTDAKMDEKVAHGMCLRDEGYNCAQAVLMPFSPELGIPADILAIISSGLGSGVGQGELCGVANALAIAEGIIRNDSSAEGKKEAMAGARDLCRAFSSPYEGCVTCKTLKGRWGRTCNQLVAEGIKLI
ncbi:MAG: C-GCAxxG-C-C family protein, partial [Muribaculaceae bacterium]|nr:C-GCAxxG-C-C family protein [Muribaculaceae bacterium]